MRETLHAQIAFEQPVGTCLRDAPAGCYIQTPEVERVHRRVRAARNDVHRDLFATVKGFYNSRWLFSGIG